MGVAYIAVLSGLPDFLLHLYITPSSLQQAGTTLFLTWVNVDVFEEVLIHVVMIALLMVARQPHILIHVEGLDVLE